jgi:hypothetical protein
MHILFATLLLAIAAGSGVQGSNAQDDALRTVQTFERANETANLGTDVEHLLTRTRPSVLWCRFLSSKSAFLFEHLGYFCVESELRSRMKSASGRICQTPSTLHVSDGPYRIFPSVSR